MKDLLRRLWRGWKALAFRMALIQATILLFGVYFTLFAVFGLGFRLLRRDLLLIRRPAGDSYWRPRAVVPITLERAERLF